MSAAPALRMRYTGIMRPQLWIAALLCVSAAFAADDVRLALALRAQTDFDRVVLAGAPALRDTAACIQSEAALASVAPPEDQPVVHFRKGYCSLAQAAATGDAAGYRSAAAAFDRALDAWPARAAALARRKLPAEPVSSGVRVLAQVARLEADGGASPAAARDLDAALAAPACPAGVMSPRLCQSVLAIGRQWQGWLAFRSGDLAAAARDFAAAPGWEPWVAGREAFAGARYAEAAAQYRRAIADWDAARQEPRAMPDRLSPPAGMSQAWADLGGAQLLAGSPADAIASLTQAVRESPANSRALFLRARAEEIAGRSAAAQADYSLAGRTAFANASDLASGEAHLYRGILLYRRRQYAQAEDEFSSALNFDVPAPLRADAAAWRFLAAVAGGSCQASRAALERALPSVSPYLPKSEARQAMAACPDRESLSPVIQFP